MINLKGFIGYITDSLIDVDYPKITIVNKDNSADKLIIVNGYAFFKLGKSLVPLKLIDKISEVR